jgi:predicted ATPase
LWHLQQPDDGNPWDIALMIRKSLLQRTRQSQVAYQDTDHFKITRDFLANLERMLP